MPRQTILRTSMFISPLAYSLVSQVLVAQVNSSCERHSYPAAAQVLTGLNCPSVLTETFEDLRNSTKWSISTSLRLVGHLGVIPRRIQSSGMIFARSLPRLESRSAYGYAPGRFSFNVKGGRCENCQGLVSPRWKCTFLRMSMSPAKSVAENDLMKQHSG